jgi:FkbM family methyltransferase
MNAKSVRQSLKKFRLNRIEDFLDFRHQSYNGVKLFSGHYRIRHRNRYGATGEPDLIRFIERLPSDTVFWDVGANVGFFSIFAALRGMHVLGFEPDQLTCGTLNKNIFLNDVSERCIALPVSLNERDLVDVLRMKHFLPANAYNTFGRSTNEYGAGFAPEFSQGSVGLAGDSISFGDALAPFSQPDFVKIDVDGNELKVVQGMTEKLRKARYLCIELSKTHPETPQTLDIIASLGFTEMADADLIDTSREKGGIQNHYFENAA